MAIDFFLNTTVEEYITTDLLCKHATKQSVYILKFLTELRRSNSVNMSKQIGDIAIAILTIYQGTEEIQVFL